MNTVSRSPRDRIMLAAVELAGEDGVHHITMSALAARAEVSRPTLYGYFPDVPHVLQARVEREVLHVQAQLQDVLAADADPIEVLSASIDLQSTSFAGSPPAH